MTDYFCCTIVSRRGESQADFSARLTRFWTHMLRNRLSDFEMVYAETTEFEEAAGLCTRMYLVEEPAIAVLENELKAAGLEHEAIDRDEVYSKYEAVPPEWMQIEH